jgi:hypothetical protein
MKTLAGLWIDQREAVIVMLSEKGRETKRIRSFPDAQPRKRDTALTKPPPPFELPLTNGGENQEYSGRIEDYYDQVISYIRPANALMLFGPGEAKGELRKRIEANKLQLRITRFETRERMTERQISENMSRQFSSEASPQSLVKEPGVEP